MNSLNHRLKVFQQLRFFVKTMGKNFGPLVEAGPLWLEHDEPLFSKAQVALPIPRVVRPRPGNGGPPSAL